MLQDGPLPDDLLDEAPIASDPPANVTGDTGLDEHAPLATRHPLRSGSNSAGRA